MPVSNASVDQLARMTRDQLRALSQSFREPAEVQEAARALIDKVATARLRAAVESFEAATPVFVEITQGLLAVAERAREHPGSEGVGVVTPLLRRHGELFTAAGETEQEEPVKALPGPGREPDDGIEDAPAGPPPGAAPPPAAPPPGVVASSTRFSEIAPEYVAMFDAAAPSPDRAEIIDRLGTKLVSFRATYEAVGRPLGVPWHLIGLIHSLESNFNFATHLHNGDPLGHRTRRVPRGRPSAEVADPPFAWSTSAIDALRLKGLHTKTEWSLAHQLFRLEGYNGFGYRFRGVASPYLWSFCDRYVKGKFVRDGVFAPDAVSGQCGAAVLLKHLIARGDVERP